MEKGHEWQASALLKELLKEKNIAVTQLEVEGLSSTSVNRFLTGSNDLSLENWLSLLAALKASTRDAYIERLFPEVKPELMRSTLFLQLAEEFAGKNLPGESWEVMREEIRMHNLSATELAQKGEMSINTLNRFINGHNDLTARKWIRIIDCMPSGIGAVVVAKTINTFLSKKSQLSSQGKGDLFIRLSQRIMENHDNRLAIAS